MEPLLWVDGTLDVVDQSLLPHHHHILRIGRVDELCSAIASLRLRGAPALGLGGAWGVALACLEAGDPAAADYGDRVRGLAQRLSQARPTAVNLSWGVGQVLAELKPLPAAQWADKAREIARRMHEADRAAGRVMGALGADFIRPGGRYLTHCNAGPLATSGVGTALAVFLEARRRGLDFEVLVDETRPLLQGARLTTLELMEAGIPVRLITDSMAPFAMARLGVDGVFVGADRIAANGDTANKVGSYGLALAARHHGVPFHVVAPLSTVDVRCPSGVHIPIEERAAEELCGFGSEKWAPEGVAAWNPAFDVVPADWIQDIVTEQGLLRPPFVISIAAALAGAPGPEPGTQEYQR